MSKLKLTHLKLPIFFLKQKKQKVIRMNFQKDTYLSNVWLVPFVNCVVVVFIKGLFKSMLFYFLPEFP